MHIREATMADAPILYEWRNDPATQTASHNSEPFSYESHVQWLERSLANSARRIFVAVDGAPVGTVRADTENGVTELSWTVAPSHRGMGIGKTIVKLVADQTSGTLRAEIKRSNIASRRIAEYIGMTLANEAGDVLHYVRPASPTP